jgi:hypothetical protein
MAHAYMAEPIEHAFIGKKMVGRYQIYDDWFVHGSSSLFGFKRITQFQLGRGNKKFPLVDC